jgi:hypothetical protein
MNSDECSATHYLVQARYTRREIMKLGGKAFAGVGAGLLLFERTLQRIHGVCCSGTPCTGNCDTGPCPTGCDFIQQTTCCEAGNLHVCVECLCGPAVCVCETDSGPDPSCP